MAATAHVQEVSRLHDESGLNDELMARATGAARSTVRDWFAHRSSPTGIRAERIGELAAIVDRLPRIMDIGYIPLWLTKPIEALDDNKPIDLIAAGEYRRVAKLIASLEDAGAV
jgi:uncharacterized protein (DUF2384 family)